MKLKVLNPSEFKLEQKKLLITYGFYESKFGKCSLGAIKNEICHLSFMNNRTEYQQLKVLKTEWPNVKLRKDVENKNEKLIDKVFNDDDDISVIVFGTPFQVKVWKHLITIPVGSTKTYQQVAEDVGEPKAVRAVATCCAKNKVSYLIPCHRVISKDRNVTKYGGGAELKHILLKYELEIAIKKLNHK